MINIPHSAFTRMFVRLNRFDKLGFARWIFMPGMEFATRDKWWERSERATPHEGLDMCCFETTDGQVMDLTENTLIPAMYNGTVIKIFNDILGFSILVVHNFQDSGKNLYSIYAHTHPVKTLKAGILINSGDPIATLCPTEKKNIPPHLHLSVIWAHETASANLNWQTINHNDHIVLCNPHDFL